MTLPDEKQSLFGEQLTIETPEQTSLDFPLAGIGSRFLALAFDTAIQILAGLLVLILAIFVFAGGRFLGGAAEVWAIAILLLAAFVLYYGYFAFFESIWNGQTPGKRRYRLRVIQDSGRPITVYQAIGRNLLRIVDQLPGFYGVGIVVSLLGRQNKRLGDYVAGTVVVREKDFVELRPDWTVSAPSASAQFNAGKLSIEEVQLIETFIARRSFLESHMRSNMAWQIAERIGNKLEVPREQRPKHEVFLEAVLQERRNQAGYH